MLITLEQRLGFTLASPAELLSELKADERFKRCRYLNTAWELTQDISFEEGWRRALTESETAFEPSDIELLSAVGSVLGKSDLNTQQQQLRLISEQLQRLISGVREQNASKERLYFTLGSLSGLAAAIMLI